MRSEEKNVFNFEAKTIDGEVLKLSRFEGRVLLIVNVASKCGFTSQYSELQELYERYEGKGLSILAFPCNDFGAQEPDGDEVIKSFCEKNFNITFDLFSKVPVLGPRKLGLYKYLYDCGLEHKGGEGFKSRIFELVKWVMYRVKGEHIPEKSEAQWNFHKFLVGKNGIPVASFLSEVSPSSSILTLQLEDELKK
ncbi:MAG: glutathione peroxidase [Nitrospinae bacterium]|nr:glutathione peroxidase [Nitrospinota bacterium]